MNDNNLSFSTLRQPSRINIDFVVKNKKRYQKYVSHSPTILQDKCINKSNHTPSYAAKFKKK